MGIDVANLSKLIGFYERLGVIKLIEKIKSGRRVRKPVLRYPRIEISFIEDSKSKGRSASAKRLLRIARTR
jgi:hypothetical protein